MSDALEKNGETLGGRGVRIDVADSQQSRPPRRGGFENGFDSSRPRRDRPPVVEPSIPAGSWRRETPLPPRNVDQERREFRRDGASGSTAPSFAAFGSKRPGAPVKSAQAGPKVNPFGGAKPVDTTQKLREVEEKLAKQRAAAQPKTTEEGH